MPLDNTEVAALSTLAGLAPLQPTDIVAVYRPGSPTPLQTARVSDIGAALGGAMTIENQGATTTTTPISLNFTTGLTVSDDGHGAETIATCFASVKDFGAKGDGTINDAAAFTAAAGAGVTIFVPPGTYKLSSSVTFTSPVVFLAGAVLAPASATTTTFNGGIVAPLTAIFSLTGSAAIAFTPATQLTAYAEWWSAVTYEAGAYPVSSPTYSDAAIQAAVNSGAASVQLMGGDYYISAAINLLNNSFTLKGVGYNRSRLVIKSATIDGVVVGPSSQPGSTSGFTNYVRVENLVIQRTGAPTSVNSGYGASPSGLRIRWTANFFARDVLSVDSSNGFATTGSLSAKFEDCYALRQAATTGSAWDFWLGYYQDNSPTISGFVSGNASVYYTYCQANNQAGSFTGGVTGLLINGGFSDTFIHGLESAACQNGIAATGTGTGSTAAITEDLKITNCVLDGCTGSGILVQNANELAQVIIANCYCETSSVGIHFSGFSGLASVTSNQIWGSGTATGISLENTCTGVSSLNNIITDCTYGVIFNGAGVCRSEDNINNTTINATAAVYMTASAFRCVVKPIVNGNASGRSGLGVKIDNGVGYCEISPSGINPGSLTSAASANKIVYNGTQITASGAFGSTNCAAPGVYA